MTDNGKHEGGCLCGALRFETDGQPDRVVFCHCRFCQRATGTAYLVEALFPRTRFRMTKGTPATYAMNSAGSGKRVVINFCATCATKIYLDLDRVPNDVGLYSGAYDDPNWFGRSPANSKHIFLDFAQSGTLVHASMNVFREHINTRDGTPTTPIVFDKPHLVK
jgi:hypothetical protein